MSDHVPQDPHFETRVRDSFARQAAMATIGAELTRVAPGEIEITLLWRADLTQQHGYLHAGIVATALDSACGYAAYSLMPADADVLSIEFKTNLLAPAAGDTLLARAHVVRAGRTVTACEGRAFMRDGEEEAATERLVATMSATMMTVRPR